MAISLKKGQREDVTLQRIGVGLGWKGEADLDASAFMLGSNGQVPGEPFIIFYNTPKTNGVIQSPEGAVVHQGDEQSGGQDDVEVIDVDLGKVDSRVEEIIFSVTIYDEEGSENFGQVRNSFIRIYNADTKEEMLRFELDEDFSTATGVEFGRLYRRGNGWRFEALGNAAGGGLMDFVKKYARAFS